MSAGGNPRRVRVAQAMRDLLAEMIDREVKDPRVRDAGFVGVNHVELNSDMSVAQVYVSFLEPAGSDKARVARVIKGLDAAAAFLRGPLARRLRLRHAPALRFIHDDTPEFHQRLTEIVRSDERARVPEEGSLPGDEE